MCCSAAAIASRQGQARGSQAPPPAHPEAACCLLLAAARSSPRRCTAAARRPGLQGQGVRGGPLASVAPSPARVEWTLYRHEGPGTLLRPARAAGQGSRCCTDARQEHHKSGKSITCGWAVPGAAGEGPRRRLLSTLCRCTMVFPPCLCPVRVPRGREARRSKPLLKSITCRSRTSRANGPSLGVRRGTANHARHQRHMRSHAAALLALLALQKYSAYGTGACGRPQNSAA